MLGDCGMLAYLSYMAERLVEIRRVLKPEGSVYLHCDPTASHYLKVLMDAIYGRGFRNEIAWCYTGPGSPKQRQFSRKHDVVLWYARGDKWTFNAEAVRVPHKKLNTNKTGAAIAAAFTPEIREEYLRRGKIPETWWTRFTPVGRIKGERLGYPTQKPIALLERIINASSNTGDVVLDPFCGCGTTVDAARKLNRRFVGIDISHFAIDLVRERRLRDSSIPVKGVPVDMHTAAMMARDAPFEFEKWAVSRVPGMVPNARQRGDGGIDGRGSLLGGGLVLAQVKGGNFHLGDFRDFLHVVERDRAECGLFTTLRPVGSSNAKREAKAAGNFEIGANRYPKAQLWSIEDYFQKRSPYLPPLADPYTGKAMQYDLFAN